MLKESAEKRVHIYYNGRVQGVGFRFAAERIALDLALTGWVKNLSDGRVELLAEGKEGALKKMLLQIENEFSGYISRKEINWMPSTGEFASFEIRFF